MTRAIALLSVLAGIAAAASPPVLPELESFEQGIPARFAAEGGKLSLATDRFIDGGHALRWDFKNGDAFVIRTGPLGNTGVWTGYGGYSRSSLTLPVYLPATSAGKLVVELRAGDTVAATIDIPLAHAGWQKLVYFYSWESHLKWLVASARDKLDQFRIRAEGITQPTFALFDAIEYNRPRDFREGVDAVSKAWYPLQPDFSREKAPTPADLAAVERLLVVIVPQPNPGAPTAHWQRRIDAARDTIRKNEWHPGRPVRQGLGTIFPFLNGLANDWHSCPDAALRKQFAEAFHTVNDWLQGQGLVVNGAMGKANNYVGREYVDAVTKMRVPLADHGTLAASLDYLKWSYDYDRLFGKAREESMDYFHNEAFRLLRIATTHGDPVERWHHVRTFREVLSQQLVASIKPDGSLYHHGIHYFAYGHMGMNSICGVLQMLAAAGLPVSREALDATKLAVMRMRWYAGGDTVLLSICGRHPSGTQRLPADAFLNLARACATGHDSGEPDRELLAAYLRLQSAKGPAFPGMRPEPSPSGFVAMPFASLGLHRRGDWLAGVKGYSRFVASGESYANANRFGLYLSNGFLELHTHPKPLPNVLGSGIRPDQGWNWCALDGTTTIHAPLDRIANGNGTRMPRSAESFVGGLAHDARHGLFTLTLNDASQAAACREQGTTGHPFRALKSWFFFDNRIICLGSGINVDQMPFPVRTTLFQKFLTDEHATTTANGESIRTGDTLVTRLFRDGACRVMDPYGNLYLTTTGDPVQLTVGKQVSRNGYDNADTEGTYSTAWIDHGLNPDDKGYEYAILVQPSADEAANFSRGTAWQVLRKDARAHIVRDLATRTTGHVVFDAGAPLAEIASPLVAVDRPCLVITEEKHGQLLVSATNPDLREKEATPQTVTVTLRGTWKPRTLPAGAATKAGTRLDRSGNPEAVTSLTIPIRHAESLTIPFDQGT